MEGQMRQGRKLHWLQQANEILAKTLTVQLYLLAISFKLFDSKVIGARFFNFGGIAYDDETTPLDTEGHGTHTASTAAGVSVEGASIYGIAEGTARGGVPSARIASYKVCWGGGCQDVDLLAAFDAAIADGVDVISVSIGGPLRNFTQDSIAIGSFHAAKKGILTVCAAGNEGPAEGTIENVAPWILTVAASTIDRKLETSVKLGNGENISGVAVNTFALNKSFYPLINGVLARNENVSGDYVGNFSACESDTLSESKVKGKIVYCQGGSGVSVIPLLGGTGTIMSDDTLDDAFPTIGPGTFVSYDDGQKIDKYINTTKSPLAIIYKTRGVNMTAPSVAPFSSRGPQEISPNILKPDIAAPGVDILAAFTKFTTMTRMDGDDRVVKYNVLSGTSMATPHAAGAAAFVKTFHPRWSPAAIKSALMTTSTPMKIKPLECELASGSGQIDPVKALHPGLIYDIDTISYISLLCRLGYTSKDIALLTGNNKYNCSKIPQAKGADGINYPSIYFQVKIRESAFSAVYYRTVTNVGVGKSAYKAQVESPKDLSIEVNPNVLTFERPYEKKSFTVTLEGKLPQNETYMSGSLVWSDSKHNSVRSPVLAVRTLSAPSSAMSIPAAIVTPPARKLECVESFGDTHDKNPCGSLICIKRFPS
ncbi:hypothetical protein DH2020_039906 [Rehmannia glutinosa]|uniref:Uncharacterized protein n=1 Tax=Rehmannia glutinosa TaxID=99300 RepID=A0ABR0UUF8_REHGL